MNPSANRDGELEGSLQIVDLEDGSGEVNPSRPYEALSYVWDEGEKTDTIRTPEGVLAITESLSLALRTIRDQRWQQSSQSSRRELLD